MYLSQIRDVKTLKESVLKTQTKDSNFFFKVFIDVILLMLSIASAV